MYAEGSTDPSPAASGGGTSAFFARPSYQNGIKGVTGYPARKGYDLVTGAGTVNAERLVPELAGR